MQRHEVPHHGGPASATVARRLGSTEAIALNGIDLDTDAEYVNPAAPVTSKAIYPPTRNQDPSSTGVCLEHEGLDS
ncbi:hypothetical protein [uncultured Jatrophihabitans sp.]|uniref:hypothetical protein n=1 Tax=uncultured Jatrophihabitans sp. TaxID=1610747 RepID=UPI0035CB3811